MWCWFQKTSDKTDRVNEKTDTNPGYILILGEYLAEPDISPAWGWRGGACGGSFEVSSGSVKFSAQNFYKYCLNLKTNSIFVISGSKLVNPTRGAQFKAELRSYFYFDFIWLRSAVPVLLKHAYTAVFGRVPNTILQRVLHCFVSIVAILDLAVLVVFYLYSRFVIRIRSFISLWREICHGHVT